MLSDALSFPRSGDDWFPTLVIGGLLTVLSFFVIPAFILQGYYVRVLRAVATGDDEAPSFTDWGGLLVDGLKLFVINVAYSLVLMIPYFALIFVVILGGNDGAGALALVLGLAIGVLGLVVGYFVPAAFTNFAIEGNFGAAFDFGTIKSGAFTSDYAMAWVLAIIVGIVGGTIGVALGVVLVGFLILFYVQIVVYYLFARGFLKGLGRTPGESETTTTTL